MGLTNSLLIFWLLTHGIILVSSATTVDSTAPAKAIGLAITLPSSNRIDLSWIANTGPDTNHYNIYTYILGKTCNQLLSAI